MTEIRDDYPLSSSVSLPEGVAYDARTHRFFATGLMSGEVTQIDAATGTETLFYAYPSPVQLSGAKVDEQHRRLWVCVSDINGAQGPVGGIDLIDLDTAKLLHHFDLARGGICNDVALDSEGVAYVTDSFLPVIYRVDARDGSAGEFVRDDQMSPPAGQFGLNGVVVTPDDKWVIGGFTSPSKLFIASLAAPDGVREIRLSGDPFAVPGSPHFTGADGIVFLGAALYVVNDGGVQQVTFTAADYSAGTVKSVLAPEAGLTTATVVDGELYVIKAEVVRAMHMRLPPNLPFKIYRFPRALFEAPAE